MARFFMRGFDLLWLSRKEPMKIKAATIAEIPVTGMKKVKLNGHSILVVRCDDGYYAVDDTCTHEESSLSEGELLNCELECALHGARFDVKTGEVLALPAVVPLQTYRTTVENDEIFVDL